MLLYLQQMSWRGSDKKYIAVSLFHIAIPGILSSIPSVTSSPFREKWEKRKLRDFLVDAREHLKATKSLIMRGSECWAISSRFWFELLRITSG